MSELENIKYKILVANEKKQLINILTIIEDISEIYYVDDIRNILRYLTRYSFHLVVLLSMKSDIEDKCEVIEIIRMVKKIPIVVLANENIEKKELFIAAGADIVLPDNYENTDIKLQIFVLMRRYAEWEVDSKNSIIQKGAFVMDYSMRRVFWNKHEVNFTKHEFDFLYLLASSSERVYTFNQIYRVVWGEYPDNNIKNIIWCMVKRMKKKMKEVDPDVPDMIHNVRNIGYFFKLETEL